MKALIVEDDAIIRKDHCNKIQKFGFECICCKDASSALSACQKTFYPLIMTDLGLPDKDGLDLCQQIRSLPGGQNSTILVVSGRDTPEHRRMRPGLRILRSNGVG